MSIQISLCPQPHSAMNFWDMTWDRVKFPGGGTMFVSARKAVFSAPVIWVGVWPASRLRAFTKSMWVEMSFMYAVRADACSSLLWSWSVLMMWCSELVLCYGIDLVV